MEFYREKFIEIRKARKISLSTIERKADISRVTLWRIEKGETIPKEKFIRSIAAVLKVGVEEISSLPKDAQLSEDGFGPDGKRIKKWISFESSDEDTRIQVQNSILRSLEDQFNESSKAIRLIKTLINFSDVMLYVKDNKHKYIAASKAFLNLVSMPTEHSISGKTDTDFFNIEEARKNTEEDQKVILSAEAIKNREDYIPGSRKKRIGLISKIPAFDNNGKLTGIVGSFIDITNRKKTEFLANDLKRCIELLENRIIWLGVGKPGELPNKSLCPKEIIYFSDSMIRNKPPEYKNNCSYAEQVEFIDSLKENPVPYDTDALKNEGVSTIYYRMRTAEGKEILNCKSSVYYAGDFDIYFGITELDVVKSYTDLLLNDLFELKLNKDMHESISGIIRSCERTMQARIEYDKFLNIRDKSELK